MISIIGMACKYADANSTKELWENILAKRISFRKIFKERLNIEDYGGDGPDSIYIKNAALITDFNFDRNKYKISGTAFRSSDMAHWLALEVAAQALEDAGFPNAKNLNKKNVGVIVGNTLTGEFSRSSLMRLRWPYVKNKIKQQLSGWDKKELDSLIESFEKNYKEPFEEPNEDSLAGGLSNTIAGRICNYFDFKGGGFAVDGACSSSLLAISQACRMLESGELEYALVGGVDTSLDPFELIGFSRLTAMAKEEMRVYDKNPTGFLPGEGCGFVLLTNKKYPKNYGQIKGWGISSDGNGGITRPEKEGQQTAIKKAYKKAGYDINSVCLFEGHGTGTPIGDEVEISALSELVDGDAFISSIKPNIGHTKAAAGIAGFIKATLAINNQILTPITNTKNPSNLLGKVKILNKAEPWPKNKPLRAGVSSFGFGGINVHITLEKKSKKIKINHDNKLINSYQDTELFLISCDSYEELKQKVNEIKKIAENISCSELGDLSYHLYKQNSNKQIRLSFIAKNPGDFLEKVNLIQTELENGTKEIINKDGLFLSSKKLKVGYLFPGQASPVRFSAGFFSKYNFIDNLYKKNIKSFLNNKEDTSHAQPAIVLSELAGLTFLNKLNIHSEVGLGHSLGELTAIHWAGNISEQDLIKLSYKRGEIMQQNGVSGSMLALICDHYLAKQLANNFNLEISAFNSKNQVIISGDSGKINDLIEECKKRNIKYAILPVRKPFHSSAMEKDSFKWQNILKKTKLYESNKKTISTLTGEVIVKDQIKQNLLNQFTKPVLFAESFDLFSKNCDLAIEVGPGNILSNLINNDYPSFPVFSLDFSDNSIEKTLIAIGALYSLTGQDINFDFIFDRFFREFKFNKTYFMNQCEDGFTKTQEVKEKDFKDQELEKDFTYIVKSIISKKTELPIEEILESQSLSKDLHMNSISVGQTLAEISKKLDLSMVISSLEFANSTVEDVINYFKNTKNSNTIVENLDGIENWVKSFSVESEREELLKNKRNVFDKEQFKWELICSVDHNFAYEVFDKLKEVKTNGLLVVMPENSEEECSKTILIELSKKCSSFDKVVLVQNKGFFSSFVKTINEEKNIDCCVVDIPYDVNLIKKIEDELFYNKGFSECFYNKNGERYKYYLKNIKKTKNQKINHEDVVVVTGGAKGITAECALNISKKYNPKVTVLLGRSEIKNKDVIKILDKFNENKLSAAYEQVDISKKEELFKVLEKIQKEYGKISVVVHGAGVNEPGLVENLNIDKLNKTLSPKVYGLKNIISFLNQNQLKYLINFSSIIGRLGMKGECDYALANSWTSFILEEYKKNNKDCICLSLEWSVWSEIGMGEKLGRINDLMKEGITPITPSKGVEELFNLIENSDGAIFVSGRLGKNPPDLFKKHELPFYRFLEKPIIFYPDIELLCEANLSNTTDLYLEDHKYKGENIFPAVVGVEAMMQAAQALANKNFVPIIKNLKLNSPIVVGENGNTIRLLCLKNENTIKLAIRCSETFFQVNHFEADLIFDESLITRADIKQTQNEEILLNDNFYGKLFFQKGLFKNIANYKKISAYESIAEVKSNKLNLFDNLLPQKLVSGDVSGRDSCLHSLQVCIPNKIVLPLSVGEIKIFKLNSEKSIIYANQVSELDGHYRFNIDVRNENGELIESWQDVVLKEIENLNWDEVPVELFNSHLTRAIKLIDCSANLFDKKIDKFSFVKEFNKNLNYNDSGKPILDSGYISFSDSELLTLSVFSENFEVSCDLEKIKEKNDWTSMLGEKIKLVDIIKEDKNISCYRIWSCMECIKKLGTCVNEPILFQEKNDNFIKFFSIGINIYSTIIDIEGHGLYSVAVAIKNEKSL